MPLVSSYVRSDGTPVRAHSRWAPGARREVMILVWVAVVVVGLGHGNGEAGGDPGPRTEPMQGPAAVHPVPFDQSAGRSAARMAEPRPTVSYPVEFDVPEPRPAPPGPTVSYPIDLSALGGGR